MPRVQFGLSSYKRARGGLPSLPVINMYAEEAPTEDGRVILQSRPGLVDRAANMGAGPIRALFQRDLVLGSALFGVSGATLYRGTTALGAIDGAGPFSIAGYELNLFVAGGASLWGYNGTTLAAIELPDDFQAVKVIIGASRAVVIRRDTGKFYWSGPLGTAIEALDFATAENSPDRLLDELFIDDALILFGAETVEFWPNTGDADLPFQPLEGRVIEKGIKATGCATAIGPTFAWVTNENQVCLQDEQTVLSDAGLQARIEATTTCRLFTFLIEGQEFLALRMGFADGTGETQVWNLRTKMWSEFASWGQPNWTPQCYAGGVFGSSLDGKTLAWGAGHTDLSGKLERRFRGGFPLNGGGVPIHSTQLRCNVGQTAHQYGPYTAPTVEMRVSRDAGNIWGNWRQASLGEQGHYRTKVQWRSCGLASYPGFLAEYRVTDPIDWRVSDVLMNEPAGGR